MPVRPLEIAPLLSPLCVQGARSLSAILDWCETFFSVPDERERAVYAPTKGFFDRWHNAPQRSSACVYSAGRRRQDRTVRRRQSYHRQQPYLAMLHLGSLHVSLMDQSTYAISMPRPRCAIATQAQRRMRILCRECPAIPVARFIPVIVLRRNFAPAVSVRRYDREQLAGKGSQG